eukprot:jgi/Psemu1/289318/fgenesh1_pg.347_\
MFERNYEHGFLGKNYFVTTTTTTTYVVSSSNSSAASSSSEEGMRSASPTNAAQHHHHQHQQPQQQQQIIIQQRSVLPLDSMKSHRKHTRASYALGGAAIGTLVFPIVGTLVGGFGVGCSVNLVMKRRERRAFHKWERDSFQEQASASMAALSDDAVFV